MFRNPFEQNGLQFSEADLMRRLASSCARARRANVDVLHVDPRGLIAGPRRQRQQLSTEEWHEFMNNAMSSLDVLADETGGICICRTNDFKKRLQRIDNEMSDYYMLGYESNNPDPLKIDAGSRSRSLRARCDVTVRI